MTTTMQALWQTFFQDQQGTVSQQQQQQQRTPETNEEVPQESFYNAAAASLSPCSKRPRTTEPITTTTSSSILPPLAPKPPTPAPSTTNPASLLLFPYPTTVPFPIVASSGTTTTTATTATTLANASLYPWQQQSQQQQQQQYSHVTTTNNNNTNTNPNPRTEHRKRKNAEYARVTRERKRNAELLLNLELASLERENERLKALVKAHMPDEQAQAVISECCYTTTTTNTNTNLHRTWLLPTTTTTTTTGPKHNNTDTKLVRSDFELIESLTKSRQAFVLTDPRLPDNPIVYASRPFLALTGYARPEVLGRNCRILQGIDTDPVAVAAIRHAVHAGTDGAACLLNYKADGTAFWNQFFVAPLRDKQGRVVNYVSSVVYGKIVVMGVARETKRLGCCLLGCIFCGFDKLPLSDSFFLSFACCVCVSMKMIFF